MFCCLWSVVAPSLPQQGAVLCLLFVLCLAVTPGRCHTWPAWALGDKAELRRAGQPGCVGVPPSRCACVHFIFPLCFSVLLMKIINQVIFLSHPVALQGQDLNKDSL